MKEEFCANLKLLRGTVSQGDFAAMFGTKQTTYSAWEKGRSEPDISTICAIANKFNVSADWLLGLDSRPPSPSTPDKAPELKRRIEAILKDY